LVGGVVLCPCSMGTLSRVSVGFSSNLVERAADVAIKERRNLILVPRETPLSTIHLENLLRLSKLGAMILPAMPGMYHAPKTMQDLADHVVGKILDALKVPHKVGARWKGDLRPAEESEVKLRDDYEPS
ncbi:MAG: UbiX family flavin prenyltransferase, partial [Planctomycetota bacterium]